MTIRAIFALLIAIFLLTACGGGGGGGESSDTTPNAISLGEETDAALSTEYTDTVTITGINRSTSISITGGEYSLDGGTTFTSDSGTVTNNQEVIVRATSAATVSTDVDVVLTVGGETGTFTITTFADTTAPTAEVVFPTVSTATDSTLLTVRGRAEDDYSAIQTVTLVVGNSIDGDTSSVTATSLNDSAFASWSGQVTLIEDVVNTITVTIEDNQGNIRRDAASIEITHQSIPASFPDENNLFDSMRSGAISFDTNSGRLIVGDLGSVLSVSIETGAREVIVPRGEITETISRLYVDGSKSAIYVSAFTKDAENIYSLNVNGSGLVAINETPSAKVSPYGLEVNPNNGRLYVADSQRVFSLNTDDNSALFELVVADSELFRPRGISFIDEDTILVVDNGQPGQAGVFLADLPGGDVSYAERGSLTQLVTSDDSPSPEDVKYDEVGSRAIFVDSQAEAVMSVSISDGSVEVISSATIPNDRNMLRSPSGIATNVEAGVAYVTSTGPIEPIYQVEEVLLLDLETGERVILSRTAVVDL